MTQQLRYFGRVFFHYATTKQLQNYFGIYVQFNLANLKANLQRFDDKFIVLQYATLERIARLRFVVHTPLNFFVRYIQLSLTLQCELNLFHSFFNRRVRLRNSPRNET